MKTIVFALLLLPGVAFGQGYSNGYDSGYIGTSSLSGIATDYEISRIMLTTDVDVTHAVAAFGTARTAATEIIELGADAPEFAWCVIDSFNALTSKYEDEPSQNHQYVTQRSNFGGWDTNTAIVSNQAATMDLLYVDWAEHIPAGVTILEAKLHVVPVNDWWRANADTVVAVLMTGENDNLWYTSKGVDDGADAAPSYAHASWRHQILGLNDHDYPATNGGTWNPELKDRQHFWEWGNFYDWTGFKASSVEDHFDQTATPSLDFAIDIRNCVQAAVNGETNNGIMIYGVESSGAFVTTRSYFWEPREGHSVWQFIPWIEIVYTAKPYKAPYPGGNDVVFMFTTDDGRRDFNHAMRDSFVAHGGEMTAFVTERFTNDESNTETMDPAELITFFDGGGVELGLHSRWHDDTHGMRWNARNVSLNKYTRGCDPEVAFVGGTTGRDSLWADADPIWLYNIAIAQGVAGGYEADPCFGKSFALPRHEWTREVFEAILYHGYKALRVGGVYQRGVFKDSYSGDSNFDGRVLHASGRYDRWTRASVYPVIADTARIGIDPYYPLLPHNAILSPLTCSSADVVGDEDATPTEAEVKRNFCRMIAEARANHSGVVSMYSHDFKGETYDNGIDAQEIGWILEVCDDIGVWMPRISEYHNWVNAHTTPIATPLGFAYSDTNNYSRESGAWALPKPETRLFPYEDKE